jgi:hypothetical protein
MDFHKELVALQTKKSTIVEQITEKRAIVDSETIKYNHQIKAKWVLVEVARQTQERLKERIESLVDMCLKAVFPDYGYEFKADFQIKNNKMACAFTVMEGGFEMVPEDDMGGSVLDICSLALKIIMWSIENPRSRRLIIQDEPFRFTGKLVSKAVHVVKELSKELHIQFIFTTHSDEMIEVADRSWEVTRPIGKKSIVVQTS